MHYFQYGLSFFQLNTQKIRAKSSESCEFDSKMNK